MRQVLLLAVLTAPVAAQAKTTIVPGRYASAEAESFTGLPFGRSSSVRAQHYYGPTHFAAASTLTSVAFRADGNKAFSGKAVDVEVFAATGPAAARAVSTAFAGNRGADWRAVLRKKRIQLPAVSAAKGPRPFAVSLAFDSGFVFDPRRGGLLVEVVVHGQQPGRFELDLGTQCASAHESFGNAGCAGSNARTPMADVPTASLRWGQGFVMRVRDALPSAPVGFLIGTIEGGRWLGLQLPYALDGLGAPGCWLNTDPALIGAAVASATGEARLAGSIPRLESLVGRWFRFQGLVLDTRANALGLTFTKGAKARICGPDPVARVVATDLTAAFGQREDGAVPVTRLSWQ